MALKTPILGLKERNFTHDHSQDSDLRLLQPVLLLLLAANGAYTRATRGPGCAAF